MHRLVTANHIDYDTVGDDSPLVAYRHWAIASAQLVDEITGEPIRVPFQARTATPQLFVKQGTDGTFCLVAQPWLRFPPAPGPRPVVRVQVTAAGFLPGMVDFTIPFDVRGVAAPALVAGDTVVTLTSTAGLTVGQILVLGSSSNEDSTSVLALGPGANQITLSGPLAFGHPIGDLAIPAIVRPVRIALHREPVVLRGRVVRVSPGGAPPTPVPNAAITLADFWRTETDVRQRPIVLGVPVGAMTGPAPNLFAVALAQGTIAPRLAGARVGPADLTPAVDSKRLLRDAAPDATAVTVSSEINLVPGRVLRLDAGDREASELHTINTLAAMGGPDDPAIVTLDLPRLRAHPPGARVDHLPPAAVAAPGTLLADAAIGDRTVFADALPAFAVQGLRLVSVGTADEYHDYELYTTTADADGYFRLPALHRVAQVRLDVNDGVAPNPFPFFVNPEYGEREQSIDLRLP
jgi:hypothetical protein